MIFLLGFAFLAGIVTILSPCILPILPIVLSGSIGKSKKRPLGIIVGFISSFTFFTLFLASLIKLFAIPVNPLRVFAALVLVIFGTSLLIPQFQVFIEKLFTKLSAFAPRVNPNTVDRQGFIGGFIIGLTIGIIWTPCVGPILASVIVLAAASVVTTVTFLITLAYAIGTAIPMFFIMIGGRKLLDKTPILLQNTNLIQRAFGILMIFFACAIFFNLDQKFEAYIASTPYGADLTFLEQNKAVTTQLNVLKGSSSTSAGDTNALFNTNTPAPDFIGIDTWLNLPNKKQSLSIKDLKGKVVLVDFWTYTCINCIRTLPHVTSWYDKYKDKGFVVVGVHTPEFQFEHNTSNVENAIQQFNIHYPVAQDNEYATWNAYNNQYWPAEYLIDANGIIRREEFGEGNYDQTEMAIRALLQNTGKKVTGSLDSLKDQTPTAQISPETYLGSARMQYYYPSGSLSNGPQSFTLSDVIPQDSFSYGGEWNITKETAIAGSNATLNYNFTAGHVYIILRPGSISPEGTVKVLLDGKVIDSTVAGRDVINSIVHVTTDRLYNLVDLHGKSQNHILELEFQTPGIEAYTFTFG